MSSGEDLAAFTEFVTARRPALLRTAYLLAGGHPQDAEDLVQTALVKAVPAWSRIRGNPEPYVRRIMVNESISRWRRRRPREVLTDAPPERPDPSSALDAVEVEPELRRALAALTPRQRAVVVLRYFEDLSERETAQLLGLSLASVKSRTRDALARMRAFLPDLEPDLEPDAEPDATAHVAAQGVSGSHR